MSKIPSPINKQNFELITERVGFILADEGAVHFPDVKVFLERIVPFDKTEVPAINIIYSASKYTSNDINNSDAANMIFIDVYEKANSTDAKRGDEKASLNLKKLMGQIRYILESVEYITLDFVAPFIRHTEVEIMNTFIPEKVGDGINAVMARINFRVDAVESVDLLQPTPAVGYNTTVKLEETEKGYQYIINN